MESETRPSFTRAAEECLKRNKDMQIILDKALYVIYGRVDVIRNRINEIKATISTTMGEVESKFRFISAWSKPRGCPPNADTIAKRNQTGGISWWEYSAIHLSTIQTEVWTGVQNRALCSIIHNLEVEEQIKEYCEKKQDLYRMIEKEPDSMKISDMKKEIAEFDTDAVRKKSLQELVLTGKGTYDWNKVSQLLHRAHTPIECQARWNQYLHPSINKSPWSLDEDMSLVMIAERRMEQDWESIAAELGTDRSAYSCFTTFQSRLQGRHLSSGTAAAEPGWTGNEDAKLAEAVFNSQGPNGVSWNIVAESVPKKTKKQVFARWTQVLNPKLKRGSLSKVEQRAIVIGVQRFGLNFAKIQNCLLPHRNVSLIRHFTLYRINNVTGRGRWLQFTEQVLKALVEFLGPERWLEVRSYFPYNSVMQLKQRYKRISSQSGNIALFTSLRKPCEMSCPQRKVLRRLLEMEIDVSPQQNSENDRQASASVTDQPGSSKQINTGAEVDLMEAEECKVQEHEQRRASLPTSENTARSLIQEENLSGSSGLGGVNNNYDCSESAPKLTESKPRRGRPPSRKKTRERTQPKRGYVQTGQFKITVEKNPDAKRRLRSEASHLKI